MTTLFSINSSANNKQMTTQWAGTNVVNIIATTSSSAQFYTAVHNAGTLTNQIAANSGLAGYGTNPSALQAALSANTANAVSITVNGTLSTATDYIILANAFMRVTP